MTTMRTLLLAAGCTAAGALGAGAGGLFGAVHAEAVVPRGADSFAKITFDRGTVVSVEGNQLTIREGTADATYDTVTLTIPDDAKVHISEWGYRRHTGDGDHEDSDQLSDLRAGDKVAVWQSVRKTMVLAKAKRDDDGR